MDCKSLGTLKMNWNWCILVALDILRRKVLLVIFVGLSESEVFSLPFCVKQFGDTSKSYGEILKFGRSISQIVWMTRRMMHFFWQGNDVGVFQVTMMMLGYDVSFLVVEVCEHLVSVTCFIVFYDVPSNFASRSVCSPLAAPYFCFLLLENFVARQFFLYQVQLSPHHHLPGGFFM